MTLSVNQRVTLLSIDDMMAMTHRYQLEVRRVLEPERVGYGKQQLRVAVIRQKGKRKESYLNLKDDDILLDGWDVPFTTDGEAGGILAGNACCNLVGDPDAIRACLEARAVCPLTDSARARVLVSPGPRTKRDDSEVELLYPEIETHHAVINRMKKIQPCAIVVPAG